jgi:cytochrome c oxidase assembly protein subunit 15
MAARSNQGPGSESAADYRSGPHRWAVVLAWTTFPLIWIGGLVTTYAAGMAVPDWPGTFGYNLFLYPWQTWLFGPWDLFIEHGHRLLGALVGLITIGFVVAVYRHDSRRWVRGLAVGALVAVIAQGSLGGARVLLDERQLAMLHGCVGPAFFALTIVLCAVTSRWWHDALFAASSQRFRVSILAIAILAYAQLVLGALLRHVSESASPLYFEVTVWAHVIGAGILAIAAGAIIWRLLRALAARKAASKTELAPEHGHPAAATFSDAAFRWPATTIALLIGLQLVLGCATWVVKYHWPTFVVQTSITTVYTLIEAKGLLQSLVVTAHTANGTLIVGVSVLLAARAWRLVRSGSVFL